MDSDIAQLHQLELAVEFYCAILEYQGIEPKYAENMKQMLLKDLSSDPLVKPLPLEPCRLSPDSPMSDSHLAPSI
jgi:hypothetical protein